MNFENTEQRIDFIVTKSSNMSDRKNMKKHQISFPMFQIEENLEKKSKNLKSKCFSINEQLLKRPIRNLSANMQTELGVELEKKCSSCVSISRNTNQCCCCCTMQDACRLQNCCVPSCYACKPSSGKDSDYELGNKKGPCCNFDFGGKGNCKCCCCPLKTNKKVRNCSKKSQKLIKKLQNKQQELQNQMQQLKKLLQLPRTGMNDFTPLSEEKCVSQEENLNQVEDCCCYYYYCVPQNVLEIPKNKKTSGCGNKKALVPNLGNQKIKSFDNVHDNSTKKYVQKLLNLLLENHKKKKDSDCGNRNELFEPNENETTHKVTNDPLSERLDVGEVAEKKSRKKNNDQTVSEGQNYKKSENNLGQTSSKKTKARKSSERNLSRTPSKKSRKKKSKNRKKKSRKRRLAKTRHLDTTKNNNKSLCESVDIFKQDIPRYKENWQMYDIYGKQKYIERQNKLEYAQNNKINYKNNVDKKVNRYRSKNSRTSTYISTKGCGKSVNGNSYMKDYKLPENSFKKLKYFPKIKNQRYVSKSGLKLIKKNFKKFND